MKGIHQNDTSRFSQFSSIADSTFFDRNDNVTMNELIESRRIIEALHHRVKHLENINNDLEYRLEDQAKQTMQAEKQYTDINKVWEDRYKELQTETSEWKQKYEQQTRKTEKLRDHLNRTEKELYSILQRKYQMMRGEPNVGNSVGNKNLSHQNISRDKLQDTSDSNSLSTPLSTGPSEESNKHLKLPKGLRERRLVSTMSGFLGI